MGDGQTAATAAGGMGVRFISTDDHVIEPPDVWTGRLEARYRDAAPRLVDEDGTECWRFEDQRVPNSGLSATSAGRSSPTSSTTPSASPAATSSASTT
jgi:hypothetical protein